MEIIANGEESLDEYQDADSSELPPYMTDGELEALQAMIMSEDYDDKSGKSLKTAGKLINSLLTQAFDSFQQKLASIDKRNNGLIFLEERDLDQIERNKYWCNITNTVKRQLTNSEYLADVFGKLKSAIVEKVLYLIDDRLVADRAAFKRIKMKIVKQLTVSRDSSALYRNNVDISMNHKLSESDRFMRSNYQQDLVRRNEQLVQSLATLQATYDTSWLVQEDYTQQIIENEEMITMLNNNLETSMEAAASLRSNIIMMKERHEDEINKIIRETRKKSLMKSEKVIVSALNSTDISADNSLVLNNLDYDENSSSNKIIDTTCKECEMMSAQIKELEGSLQIAKHSLEVSQNLRKRSAIISSNQATKLTKNSKNSKSIGFMAHSLTHVDDDEDGSVSLLSKSFRNDKKKMFRPHSGAKKKTRKKRSSTDFKSGIRTRNGSIDSTMSDFSEASDQSGLHGNTGNNSFYGLVGLHPETKMNHEKDGNHNRMSLRNLNDTAAAKLNSLRINSILCTTELDRLNIDNSPINYDYKRNIIYILEHYNVTVECRDAIITAVNDIQIQNHHTDIGGVITPTLAPIPVVLSVDCNTQTDSEMDILLNTYLDATKEAVRTCAQYRIKLSPSYTIFCIIYLYFFFQFSVLLCIDFNILFIHFLNSQFFRLLMSSFFIHFNLLSYFSILFFIFRLLYT